MEVHPLTPDRWGDLVELFGPNGAYSGCWCMWFRQTNAEMDASHGDPNRDALRAIVDDGRPTGLLGYDDGQPVGWVSMAPRGDFGRLDRSPVAKRVDEEPVWSIVCFFVGRGRRGSGIARGMLDAAVDHARRHGAAMLEAYPVDATAGRKANASMYTGSLSMFLDAGFEEVVRHKAERPIVRRRVD